MSLPLSPSLSLPENERAKVSLIIVAGGAAGGQLPACLPALWYYGSCGRLFGCPTPRDTTRIIMY